jgi:hypothetical protein
MGVGLIVFLAVQAAQPAEIAGVISIRVATEDITISPATESETPTQLILSQDTPVHLMVVNAVTTKTHQAGHRFKLRANKSVMLNGQVVIPVGATAWGEVTAADNSGNVGKSGTMSANLLYVEVNNTRYPISGGTTSKGKSGTAETIMAVLALGPLGLFAKGNNAKIKAGELMTAFTTSDVLVPSAK